MSAPPRGRKTFCFQLNLPPCRLILQDCEDDPVRVLNPEGWPACLMPARSSNLELPVQNHAAADDFDSVTAVAFRGSSVIWHIALG